MQQNNNGLRQIPVSKIIFRADLYPRIETSAVTVQKYAEDLSVLPPIEINQNNELIDGWHRWTAHKKANAETIPARVTNTTSDGGLLELAIQRNAAHGHQLSTSDKKRVARRIYREAPAEERGQKKQRLAEILSMSYDTINRWLNSIDKDTEEERNAAIQNLYLQCYTQEEIAAQVGIGTKQVETVYRRIRNYEICGIPGQFSGDAPDDAATDRVKREFESARQVKIIQSNRSNADHACDFDVPIYNIWSIAAKTEGSSHFGNSEVTWVDRLLYLYTRPFDIVIDPFAGGGSTLDICRKRFRRCWISDRKPIIEREKEIRQLDTVRDLPALHKRWDEVSLTYLDPPYWKQAEGKYSKDKEDLANMSLEEFTEAVAGLVNRIAKKQSKGVIALLIQPTQWNAPKRQVVDHVIDIIKRVKLPVENRVSCPYSTEQSTPQMVEWAKSNKQLLVRTRELIIWRVS